MTTHMASKDRMFLTAYFRGELHVRHKLMFSIHIKAELLHSL